MVERELGASRAEVVLSEHPPKPGVASAPMLHGFRVEVQFDDPSADLAHAATRLAALVESFAGVLAEAALPTVRDVPNTIVHTLEDALDSLTVPFATEFASIARHLATLGASVSELLSMESIFPWLAERNITGEEANAIHLKLTRLQRLEAIPEGAQLRVIRAISACRDAVEDETVHAFERRFAGIYTLILVFDGAFSELHAEAAVLRALPTIEKLVTSLPPRDPIPQGAKVARLRRLRRV